MMSRCLANRVRLTFVLSHTNSLHHGARDAESLVVVSCSEATVGGKRDRDFGQACILESAAMVDESARGVGSSYLDGYADYYSAAPGGWLPGRDREATAVDERALGAEADRRSQPTTARYGGYRLRGARMLTMAQAMDTRRLRDLMEYEAPLRYLTPMIVLAVDWAEVKIGESRRCETVP